MEYVYIDFEYNNASSKHPELVCASWQVPEGIDPDTIHNIWLYKNTRNQRKLYNILKEYADNDFIFVSFAVTAEARCFNALGLDPTTCRWVDLYIEWRQLRNGYDKFNYGYYYVRNIRSRSVIPDHRNPANNVGRDNTQVPYSLDGCVGHLLKENVDSILKRGMRDLILSAPEQFTEEEQKDILEYCDSDIKYLPQIHSIMTEEIYKALKTKTPEEVEEYQLKRGEFAAHMALVESHGIPLDMDAAQNLRRNVEMAKDKLIQDLVTNHYPFFERKKKKKADLLGYWTDKYSQFAKFIENEIPHTLAMNWQTTDSGRYKSDDEYLAKFDNIPAIHAYRQTRKLLNQLKWFRVPEEGKEDLFNSVGPDNRMRSFFGIYGTQTARNAPMAKKFIFAMSAWLRCLIRPPKGYVITELDYGSQEFAIAALLSQDKSMIEAYRSGDPYLYFAKKARAVPEKGTKAEFKKERDLFKATTLGLQYGMGSRSLAVKLTADTGTEVDEEEARDLIELHQTVYPRYWRWLDKIERTYTSSRQGYLQLPCGWTLFGDNPQMLSVRNFPTQGAGSSIIREAVAMLKELNIPVIATLHDASYIMTPTETTEKQVKAAKAAMSQAFKSVLKTAELDVRIDVSSHTAEEPWVSEKGARFYELLKEYLGHQVTREDKIKHLMGTVFK